MIRISLLASVICLFSFGASAQPVSSANAIIPGGTGLTVGQPSSGPLGPGFLNVEKGVSIDGVPIAGGVAIPAAPLLGGVVGGYVSVTLGTNLSLDPTSHVLSATGGGASLPTSAPLVGSNSGGSGVAVTPTNGLTVNGSAQLVPTFGTSANTIAQGNDSRIVGALQSVPAPTTSVLGGLLAATAQSGQFVSFVDSSGVQHFATPAGGGNVSNTGTPSSGQIAVWAGSTVVGGASAINAVPIGTTTPSTGAFTTGSTNAGFTDSSPATSVGMSTTGALSFGGTIPASGSGVVQGSVLSNITAYNYPTAFTIRNRFLSDVVTATTNSSFIDEGMFLDREYSGTATIGGEINGYHSFFKDAVGLTFTGPVEQFEASNVLNVAHQQVVSYLAINNVTSTGSIVGDVDGLVTSLTNANVTPGTVHQYDGVLCKAGSGAAFSASVLPTNYNCLYNGDALQNIVTAGKMNIGSPAEPSASVMLEIFGTSTSTFPLIVVNNAASNLFYVRESGGGFMSGTMQFGSTTAAGAAQLFNGANGGSILLQANTAATSGATVSFPVPSTGTDTIALLGTPQVFTNTVGMSGLGTGTAVSCLGLTSGNQVIPTSCSGSGGGITSITAGAGLTGGTITTSGTIALDTTATNTWTGLQTFNANIVTSASSVVGIGGANPGIAGLYILAPDTSGSTLALRINAGGKIAFSVTDAGNATLQGALTLGLQGTSPGQIGFVNATSGNLQFAPPTGALGNHTLLLPIPSSTTDTLAILGTTQTFTATNNFATILEANTTTILANSTVPTVASGFGTSPTIPHGTSTAWFQVNVGTGGTASSGVLTLPAATNGWGCNAVESAANIATLVTRVAPTSVTSVTLSSVSATTGLSTPWPASDVVTLTCTGG